MLNWQIGWKGYAIGAGLALAAAWGYGQWQYHAGHAAAEQERAVTDLKQYKQAANDLLTATQAAQPVLDGMQSKFTTFQEAYKNEMRINPIDCVGTDGRLRSILDLYPATTTRRND
ncbi:hypothetical protein TKWG_13250 [Advenella kashmirensis WT001]|uniref:Uncharacterized protein n=1 Tax=Advenella kashmirensis (strain DSM 17095 / LMG 22695 / WT001) TaxID=1036672 RepID=I3UCN6_ADVKW|nr:hypothetical protein [Advenella kashmirensis]AFK62774.1 hypothetical protein TKWG_13250 [Advenella kashmirensis WT001]